MPDLNAPNFSAPSGNTQLALQAPTDLQRQLDNYVANWNPQNNAPFSYAGPGQNLPLLQGGPFQPPPLGLQFRPLSTNANLFMPSSIFSPTFNKQGTGTQQVGVTTGLPTNGGLGPPNNNPGGAQFQNPGGVSPGTFNGFGSQVSQIPQSQPFQAPQVPQAVPQIPQAPSPVRLPTPMPPTLGVGSPMPFIGPSGPMNTFGGFGSRLA